MVIIFGYDNVYIYNINLFIAFIYLYIILYEELFTMCYFLGAQNEQNTWLKIKSWVPYLLSCICPQGGSTSISKIKS